MPRVSKYRLMSWSALWQVKNVFQKYISFFLFFFLLWCILRLWDFLEKKHFSLYQEQEEAFFTGIDIFQNFCLSKLFFSTLEYVKVTKCDSALNKRNSRGRQQFPCLNYLVHSTWNVAPGRVFGTNISYCSPHCQCIIYVIYLRPLQEYPIFSSFFNN